MKISRTVYPLIVCVLMAVLLIGCGDKKPAEVSSPWPTADSERVVTEPAELHAWPLTGLPAPAADVPMNLRVLSVKIENSAASRPQSGIQSADVVYESITEGGITRLNALFHSQVPSTVGPVRSARLSDVHIVPQYGALFAFSGAHSQVSNALRNVGIENLSEDVGVTYGYERSSAHSAPHNLYLDLTKMREEATRRGYAKVQTIKPLAFGSSGQESTLAVSQITIPFSQSSTAKWTYDKSLDAYLRVDNGAVHEDALTGEQIAAKNVVVMWAKTTSAGRRDKAGSMTYDIELVGSNRVAVFRNGQRYDGVWEATKSTPPTFKAEDGTAIRLMPGATWFQIVSSNVNIAVE